MLWRTHLAIGLAAALYFSTHVNDPLVFVAIVLVSGLFPDIESKIFMRRKREMRPTSVERGIIHSYTLCILLSIVLAFVWPVAALPFFIGYSFHLFADSFTLQGIRPFWPIKTLSKGVVRPGGRIDKALFYTFVIIDVILVATIIYTSF